MAALSYHFMIMVSIYNTQSMKFALIKMLTNTIFLIRGLPPINLKHFLEITSDRQEKPPISRAAPSSKPEPSLKGPKYRDLWGDLGDIGDNILNGIGHIIGEDKGKLISLNCIKYSF